MAVSSCRLGPGAPARRGWRSAAAGWGQVLRLAVDGGQPAASPGLAATCVARPRRGAPVGREQRPDPFRRVPAVSTGGPDGRDATALGPLRHGALGYLEQSRQ